MVIFVEADNKLKDAQKEGVEVCEILQKANDDDEKQDGMSVESLQVPTLEDLQKTASPLTSEDQSEKANKEGFPKSVFTPIAKDINQKQVSHFKAMALLGKLFFGMKKPDTINEDNEPSLKESESSYEEDSDDFEDDEDEEEDKNSEEEEEEQVKDNNLVIVVVWCECVCPKIIIFINYKLFHHYMMNSNCKAIESNVEICNLNSLYF